MGDKKHLGRFTVQFNLGDPQQARVSEILEHHGRQKARFISTAILHYINCKEISEVALPPFLNASEIEKIVLAVIQKQMSEKNIYEMQQQAISTEKLPHMTQNKPSLEHNDSADELKALLGDGGFAAIANTLASFQEK